MSTQPAAVPKPGYAGLHTAYEDFQRQFMNEYRKPIRTGISLVYRPGVQRDQLEHLFKIFFPVMVAVVVIRYIVQWVT